MSDRWFFRQRQDWIAETVRVFGFINRAHIERKFEISTPQASLDLQHFQKSNPGVLHYNGTAKRYEAASLLQTTTDCIARRSTVLAVLWKYSDGPHKGARFWACHGMETDGRLRDWPKMNMVALGAASVEVMEGEGLDLLPAATALESA